MKSLGGISPILKVKSEAFGASKRVLSQNDMDLIDKYEIYIFWKNDKLTNFKS